MIKVGVGRAIFRCGRPWWRRPLLVLCLVAFAALVAVSLHVSPATWTGNPMAPGKARYAVDPPVPLAEQARSGGLDDQNPALASKTGSRLVASTARTTPRAKTPAQPSGPDASSTSALALVGGHLSLVDLHGTSEGTLTHVRDPGSGLQRLSCSPVQIGQVAALRTTNAGQALFVARRLLLQVNSGSAELAASPAVVVACPIKGSGN